MATPGTGRYPQIAATPPVTTPLTHLTAFHASPRGPRSGSHHPSPQQFKKSPANSQTVYGHPTPSFTGVGAMNFDSPTTAALASLPLADLGLGDGMLGGLGGLGLPRSDEDEKKRKLQTCIDILSKGKSRVSEEGVERLARRYGLECLWEDQLGSGGKSKRTLIIAGTGLSIEMDFVNQVVGQVALSFPEAPEIVNKHAESGSLILLKDLQLGAKDNVLTSMLDKFDVNLERLAALDRLSVMPTLSCYEAVAGIYESLKILNEWETKRVRESEEMKEKDEAEVQKRVLCRKSGRPVMNTRGQVGAALEYWQQNLTKGKQEPKTWSMILECAPSSALSYQSIRVTDKWISDTMEKLNPVNEDASDSTNEDCLYWQNPDNTILPATEGNKDDTQMAGIDSIGPTSKLPDVMFVAKFDPPLIMPYNTALGIFTDIGHAMDQSQPLATLDGLLFPPSGIQKQEDDGSYRRIHAETQVLNFSDEQRHEVRHDNTLVIYKADYGYALTQLPFSHPRQLVDKLPILRQYARLAGILEHTFSDSATTERKAAHGSECPSSTHTKLQKPVVQSGLAAFMSATTIEPPGCDNVVLDVSLTTHPSTRLRVQFPLTQDKNADVSFEITENGIISTSAQNFDIGRDLAKLLDVAEDLGTFAEYVRSKAT